MATRLSWFTLPELQRDSLEGLVEKATTLPQYIAPLVCNGEKRIVHIILQQMLFRPVQCIPQLPNHCKHTKHQPNMDSKILCFSKTTFIRGVESRLALLIFTTFTAQLLVIGQFHSDQVSTFVIFPKPLQTVASGRRIWLQLVGEGTRIGTPELL